MGRTYSKNEGQQVDQTLHRLATKEREETKRTTTQKMAGTIWNRKATERRQWKALIEGYTLQSMDKASVKGES